MLPFATVFWMCCTSSHVGDATETGNPPFLDLDEISLVVSADGVRIVGEPGAVKPGGAEITLENVATGEVARGKANADGSFDIAIDASADAVIEVRASSGGESSGSVYVTRGGAMVGSDGGSALSCMERSQLASQAIGGVLTSLDSSCETAADCKFVPYRTSCTDACGDALVSAGEVERLQDTVRSIGSGICRDFAADGCTVEAQPCPPPLSGPVQCVAGRCEQLERPLSACEQCFDTAMGPTNVLQWGPTNNSVRHTISACQNFARVTRTEAPCLGNLPSCRDESNPWFVPTVEDLVLALRHPDVERALASGELVGGAPPPGGFSTSITLGDRSFVISNCGTGPSCDAVPAGVQNLRAVLDDIAQGLGCEHSECDPTERFVEDLCAGCAPENALVNVDGCGARWAECAVTCSDDSDCTIPDARAATCSERGICERFDCR